MSEVVQSQQRQLSKFQAASENHIFWPESIIDTNKNHQQLRFVSTEKTQFFLDKPNYYSERKIPNNSGTKQEGEVEERSSTQEYQQHQNILSANQFQRDVCVIHQAARLSSDNSPQKPFTAFNSLRINQINEHKDPFNSCCESSSQKSSPRFLLCNSTNSRPDNIVLEKRYSSPIFMKTDTSLPFSQTSQSQQAFHQGSREVQSQIRLSKETFQHPHHHHHHRTSLLKRSLENVLQSMSPQQKKSSSYHYREPSNNKKQQSLGTNNSMTSFQSKHNLPDGQQNNSRNNCSKKQFNNSNNSSQYGNLNNPVPLVSSGVGVDENSSKPKTVNLLSPVFQNIPYLLKEQPQNQSQLVTKEAHQFKGKQCEQYSNHLGQILSAHKPDDLVRQNAFQTQKVSKYMVDHLSKLEGKPVETQELFSSPSPSQASSFSSNPSPKLALSQPRSEPLKDKKGFEHQGEMNYEHYKVQKVDNERNNQNCGSGKNNTDNEKNLEYQQQQPLPQYQSNYLSPAAHKTTLRSDNNHSSPLLHQPNFLHKEQATTLQSPSSPQDNLNKTNEEAIQLQENFFLASASSRKSVTSNLQANPLFQYEKSILDSEGGTTTAEKSKGKDTQEESKGIIYQSKAQQQQQFITQLKITPIKSISNPIQFSQSFSHPLNNIHLEATTASDKVKTMVSQSSHLEKNTAKPTQSPMKNEFQESPDNLLDQYSQDQLCSNSRPLQIKKDKDLELENVSSPKTVQQQSHLKNCDTQDIGNNVTFAFLSLEDLSLSQMDKSQQEMMMSNRSQYHSDLSRGCSKLETDKLTVLHSDMSDIILSSKLHQNKLIQMKERVRQQLNAHVSKENLLKLKNFQLQQQITRLQEDFELSQKQLQFWKSIAQQNGQDDYVFKQQEKTNEEENAAKKDLESRHNEKQATCQVNAFVHTTTVRNSSHIKMSEKCDDQQVTGQTTPRDFNI